MENMIHLYVTQAKLAEIESILRSHTFGFDSETLARISAIVGVDLPKDPDPDYDSNGNLR